LTVAALTVAAFVLAECAAAERATVCFLAARWWRSRAIRFWARALSVTCPLDLALVLVVLELRANNAPDEITVETKRTRRRSRNVIGVTATWVTKKNLFF